MYGRPMSRRPYSFYFNWKDMRNVGTLLHFKTVDHTSVSDGRGAII
jgi:hypothetical protein